MGKGLEQVKKRKAVAATLKKTRESQPKRTAKEAYAQMERAKLAELLSRGEYEPRPLSEPVKPETATQRHKRLLERAKSGFRALLDEQFRKRKDSGWKFDFLDVPVEYTDFEEIFTSFNTGQYKYDPLQYQLKRGTWFYDFLLWLSNEKFQLESIKTNHASSWEDDNTYSFRVRW